MQCVFADLTGATKLSRCKLFSKSPTAGQRLLYNVRTRFDNRFAEYERLKCSLHSAIDTTTDTLLSKIELPKVAMWENSGCSPQINETTCSQARALTVLKEAEEYLVSVRWDWENLC